MIAFSTILRSRGFSCGNDTHSAGGDFSRRHVHVTTQGRASVYSFFPSKAAVYVLIESSMNTFMTGIRSSYQQ